MKKIIILVFLYLFSVLNSEAQWIQQNSGTNQNLYDIEFINEKTGWAVGDAGVVIKTTNGGTNWLYLPNPSPLISPNLWSVCPIDENIVYVTSSGDFIMKTTNGGLNWDVLHSCPSCNSSTKGIYFLNKDTGWVLGAYKVFRTYDGGITLDSFYVPWFTNFDIYFKDINTGIFCGTGRVFKSTDKGENWIDTHIPVGGSFPMFRKLGFSGNNIWLGGGNPKIYKSTDLGENWIISDSSIGADGIGFVNDSIGFIGGGLNTLYKTTNGGYNFYRQKTDPSSLAFISSIAFVNELTGWYCCAVGRIYKTTNGGEWLTNINSQFEELSSEDFKLLQNYPNPFNPSTYIEYQLFKQGFVELDVFNITGKIISTIVNENKSPGNYKVKFESRGIPSGIYFYNLKIDGKLVNVKKMIILK
ncbi:MAG TPA: YCF48-related protein [Ignavibacteria bacterium]|nr:YCF48-related protein [Ignavibacteria bacterium]HQY51735.1 YCF48-related protein [Ignavibacteria bacterium]